MLVNTSYDINKKKNSHFSSQNKELVFVFCFFFFVGIQSQKLYREILY